MPEREMRDKRKYRSRFNIMALILEVAKDEVLRTHIMYGANLGFSQLNEYLSFLVKIKLLKIRRKHGKTFYKTSPKGSKYLKRYREIKSLLKGK